MSVARRPRVVGTGPIVSATTLQCNVSRSSEKLLVALFIVGGMLVAMHYGRCKWQLDAMVTKVTCWGPVCSAVAPYAVAPAIPFLSFFVHLVIIVYLLSQFVNCMNTRETSMVIESVKLGLKAWNRMKPPELKQYFFFSVRHPGCQHIDWVSCGITTVLGCH